MLEVLPQRFARYGLTIHPDKTRLVPFDGRITPTAANGGPRSGLPGSFDLLGFSHYWARSQKGNWIVKQKTAKNRLRRAIRNIAKWCRLTGIDRFVSSIAPCARSYAATTRTMESPATADALSRFRTGSHRALEEMACPSQSRRRSRLGATLSPAGALPASAGDHDRPERLLRQAVCPWPPHLGLPDPRLSRERLVDPGYP